LIGKTGVGSEDSSVGPYRLKQNGRRTSSGAGYSGDSIVNTQVLSPVVLGKKREGVGRGMRDLHRDTWRQAISASRDMVQCLVPCGTLQAFEDCGYSTASFIRNDRERAQARLVSLAVISDKTSA